MVVKGTIEDVRSSGSVVPELLVIVEPGLSVAGVVSPLGLIVICVVMSIFVVVLPVASVVVSSGADEVLVEVGVVGGKVWVLFLSKVALVVVVGSNGVKVEANSVVLVVLEKRTKMEVVGRKMRMKQKKPRPPTRTFLRFISFLFTGFYSTVMIQERPLSPPLKSR